MRTSRGAGRVGELRGGTGRLGPTVTALGIMALEVPQLAPPPPQGTDVGTLRSQSGRKLPGVSEPLHGARTGVSLGEVR